MSIKIISKGMKERTKYRVECPECGCVYEYNKEDIKSEFIGMMLEPFTYHTICPHCHNKVNHEENFIENL